MRILVTGGTGFIGSHTCIELINAGYDVVIADNLYNSKALVVDRIEELAGKRPVFYEVDVTDKAASCSIKRKSTRSFTLRATRQSASRRESRSSTITIISSPRLFSATLCGITA